MFHGIFLYQVKRFPEVLPLLYCLLMDSSLETLFSNSFESSLLWSRSLHIPLLSAPCLQQRWIEISARSPGTICAGLCSGVGNGVSWINPIDKRAQCEMGGLVKEPRWGEEGIKIQHDNLEHMHHWGASNIQGLDIQHRDRAGTLLLCDTGLFSPICSTNSGVCCEGDAMGSPCQHCLSTSVFN